MLERRASFKVTHPSAGLLKGLCSELVVDKLPWSTTVQSSYLVYTCRWHQDLEVSRHYCLQRLTAMMSHSVLRSWVLKAWLFKSQSCGLNGKGWLVPRAVIRGPHWLPSGFLGVLPWMLLHTAGRERWWRYTHYPYTISHIPVVRASHMALATGGSPSSGRSCPDCSCWWTYSR